MKNDHDHRVAIRSDKGKRAVSLAFPDYPAVGFRRMPLRKMGKHLMCVWSHGDLPPGQEKVLWRIFAPQEDLVALDGGKICM
ncbi:MAG: hypothetical protein ACLTSZ_13690 [Lachnospiraceae bacterium]